MPAKPTGADILAAATRKLGQTYVFGASVPLNDPSWDGPWDCAELASWAVYQVARKIYGCVKNSAAPAKADPFTGAWLRDAKALGAMISIDEAAVTPGAMLLFRGPSGGHIAISDGSGDGTVEARNSAFGVCRHVVHGRDWTTGVLVPGVSYQRGAVDPPGGGGAGSGGSGPPDIVRDNAPMPRATLLRRYARPAAPAAALVLAAQEALRAGGFLDKEPSGRLDLATQHALAQYQIKAGLTPIGRLDADTQAALGLVKKSGAKPGGTKGRKTST